MLFSASVFIFGFLPAAVLIYYLLLRNKRKAQNIFLTVISLLFYAWGEPLFVLVMLASCMANWFFALKIDKHKDNKQTAKRFVTGMTACNLLVFFIFKYLSFTAKNLLFFIPSVPSFITAISLPIGISFFTFQAMSYCFDVYRGNGEVQKNPLNVILYISLFPQLIAGPIVRYSTIADQIQNRRETLDDFLSGFYRFMIGFSKKWILANNLAYVADTAFSADKPSVMLAWIGVLAYTFQIFFDFSAYSDMAIGLGKMFGFHFLENFNLPYISRSISEFWRRWHISLGTWFRDYVYFPLGGSRVGKKRLVLNLFIVWTLTGVWHGANWTFLLWGLLYFVLLTAEKILNFNKLLQNKYFSVFGHFYTLFFVIIGWVLFRSNSLSHAAKYIVSMFGGAEIYTDKTVFLFREYAAFYLLAAIFAFIDFNKDNRLFKSSAFALVKNIILICSFVIAISYMILGSYNPFIYFNF